MTSPGPSPHCPAGRCPSRGDRLRRTLSAHRIAPGPPAGRRATVGEVTHAMSAPAELPRTVGELRAAGHAYRTVKEELRDNLLARLRTGETALPRHRRLRRHRAARGRAGHPGRPRHGAARRARPGQDPADPLAGRPARRVDAGDRRLRAATSTRCTRSRRRSPAAAEELGDDLPVAWLHRSDAVRREARHPGHQRRRPDRRRRPDQGRPGPHPRRPGDHPLRPGAAHQPGHLRRQRAARPGRADPGRRCSTCWRSATSRSAATSCGCRSTCCWWPAPTRRTTPTAAGSSPRSRTGSAPRSAPTTRSTSSWRST